MVANGHMKIYKIVLFTILLSSTLTLTVQAYESDILIWITDSDYSKTVEASGIIDLEITVSYNFSQAARLNVWVMDGPWYSYDTEILTDEYFDVNEAGPKEVSLQVTAPEEAGQYRFTAEAGWCELDSTELLPQLGGYQEYNITFTVTPIETTDTGGDTTTGEDITDEPDTDNETDETEDTTGIPGFPVLSIVYGIVIVSSILLRSKRSTRVMSRGLNNL